eukprot:7216580-Prymnesium_polylepis.1
MGRSEFGTAEADGSVVSCFPDNYALPDARARERCVPEANVPLVRRRSCGHAKDKRVRVGCVVHGVTLPDRVACPGDMRARSRGTPHHGGGARAPTTSGVQWPKG